MGTYLHMVDVQVFAEYTEEDRINDNLLYMKVEVPLTDPEMSSRTSTSSYGPEKPLNGKFDYSEYCCTTQAPYEGSNDTWW